MITKGLGITAKEPRRWKSYRRNRLFFILLILGWIPAVRILDLLHRQLGLPLQIAIVGAIAWIIAIVAQGWRLAIWPCPNCGRSIRGFMPFLPQRCRSCGFPVESQQPQSK